MHKAVIDLYLGSAKADPIKEVDSKLQELGYFNNHDVGMYNKVSSSIVKLKDDGVIDIFAGTNQGMRIDPERRCNNFFSLNENHYLINCTFKVHKELTLNVKRNINISALRFNVDCDRDNFSVGGISLKNMDDVMAKNAQDIIQLNNNIDDVSNEVSLLDNNLGQVGQETTTNSSSIETLLNRVAQLESYTNSLANRISNLEGGE